MMTPDPRKRLIVVLGMHRSGTSAIARALQVLGVELGDRLIPPKEDNPKGFFEDIDLTALNIELLSAIGSDWHQIAPIDRSDVEVLRKKGYFLRAVEIVRQKTRNARVFGFKDPRTAKLLPFWKEVFDLSLLDTSYILTARHPLSVATSLARRERFHVEKSYLLWLDHVITSLMNSSGEKRTIVDYDRLMQSPERELDRIAQALDLQIDADELKRYQSEFLDEGLRHTVYALNDLSLDNACPPLAHEVYATLLKAATDKIRLDDVAFEKKTARWEREFERIKPILNLVDRFSTEEIRAAEMLNERDRRIDDLLRDAAERDQHAADLNQVLAERDEQIAGLIRDAAERDQHAADLNRVLAERDAQIADLNRVLAGRDQEAADLNRVLSERDEQIADLNQAVAERDGQIAELQQAVDYRDNVVSQLVTSTSWRLTRPIRALKSTLTKSPGSFDARENSRFNADWYLKHNPDVRDSCLSPEAHYALYGKAEGRVGAPDPFLSRNIKRLKVIGQGAPIALRQAGGVKAAVKKAPALLAREGLQGIKSRLIAAYHHSAPSPANLDQTGAATENALRGETSPLIPPEVARPIEIDYSAAVPFGFRRRWSHPHGSLAVICHMFYEELASEFRRYLLNIPFEFDLFISTDDNFKKAVIEKAFAGWDRGSVEVRVTRNCGRDIAPKLIGFKDIYGDYEFTLHLHSKSSDHADVLANWRGFLLENLLGSQEIVLSVFDAFDQRPDLGIVASQHFEPTRPWINWGGNFPLADRLARRIGFHISEEEVLDFPSGSMFWARTAALKPLLDANLSVDDFATESGQIDGTLAHAIERLYYHVCEHAGFEWIKISNPKLFEQTPAIISIENENALDRFISICGLRLTGPNLPAPRKAPPPHVSRPAPCLVSRLQAGALGVNLKISPASNVFVGVVTYENDESMVKGIVDSARVALTRAGLVSEERILIVDNGRSSRAATADDSTVIHLASEGNVGFGAAHNRLMAEAFELGADLYIAANPDGSFHPDAITALVQMMQAHQYRALIEAIQFPVEHPKPYDPVTFETPWASGACLAVPRAVFETLGGFDETFFMYCEDVDLSWRARANGFTVRTCPRALFHHAVTNRPRDPEVLRMIFNSGVILARKWTAPSFEKWLTTELLALGNLPPDVSPKPVPEAWRRYSDFSNHFTFAKARW